MSTQDNGGPAFPREDYQTDHAPGQSGMTLRDYFAAHIAGHLSVSPLRQKNTLTDDAAYAYRLADAMLEARRA